MAGEVVPKKTVEDLIIEIEERKLEAKREQVAKLCLMIEEMKAELRRFEAEYGAKVGRLLLELEKIELKAREYDLKLRIAQSNPYLDEEEIEREAEREIEGERRRIAEEERRIEEAGKKMPELSEEERREMRRLYLKLAKRYHPDKAGGGSERMMAIINRAYEEGDLELLRRLASEADEIDDVTPKKRRIELLRRENERLDRVIRELKGEMEKIRSSPLYRLKQQVEQARKRGEDLLERLADEVRAKIELAKSRLRLASERFRVLMALRKAARGVLRWL
ncbi:hypothetical protein DRP77_00245 [Candidatus Poribacteria bacterium]|nr:MAG: hypothetical protein DRP77_00245 [Candidatus Poribacteria bacterium]